MGKLLMCLVLLKSIDALKRSYIQQFIKTGVALATVDIDGP